MDLHQWLLETNPLLARRLVFITGGVFTPRANNYLDSVPNMRLQKPLERAKLLELVGEFARSFASS